MFLLCACLLICSCEQESGEKAEQKQVAQTGELLTNDQETQLQDDASQLATQDKDFASDPTEASSSEPATQPPTEAQDQTPELPEETFVSGSLADNIPPGTPEAQFPDEAAAEPEDPSTPPDEPIQEIGGSGEDEPAQQSQESPTDQQQPQHYDQSFAETDSATDSFSEEGETFQDEEQDSPSHEYGEMDNSQQTSEENTTATDDVTGVSGEDELSNPAHELNGTRWQLVKIVYSDDTTYIAENPVLYTLDFFEPGRVAVRLNCNRANGTWKITDEGALEFGPLMMTKAMCEDMTIVDLFVRDWPFFRSYLLKDGHLFLNLFADGGVYEFAPFEADAE